MWTSYRTIGEENAGAAARLAEELGFGTFWLGGSPLDGLDAAPSPVPQTRRCLAALGPKMLALSSERSPGAHAYFVPVEHTRAVRTLLGPSPLLAPDLACVRDDDAESARASDHVCLQTVAASAGVPTSEWTGLASALGLETTAADRRSEGT